ncbi:MAG TPA: sigma-70 family RNA polymerase sigma factor [Polyangiaceae bacterium]
MSELRASKSSIRGQAAPEKVIRLPLPDDDAALVDALRAGRPDARAALFDRNAPHVRRVLLRVLGADSEISDLLHELFLEALERIHQLKNKAALKQWLTGMAVYKARSLIRKRARRRLVRLLAPEELEQQALAENAADPEAQEAVRALYRVLDGMPVDERIGFALRFVDGMDLGEIAGACRVSRATVIRRLARAQQHFLEGAGREPALGPWLEGGNRWNT